MTVTSDSEWLEDLPALLSDWLATVVDVGARALIVLGPSVVHDQGNREVLATHGSLPSGGLPYIARALASSDEFEDWPLVSWQDLVRGSEVPGVLGLASDSWRSSLREEGIISFTRVALELPGRKAFEIYTFSSTPIKTRADASAFVWAAMGAWPDVRRALSTTRLKLSSRERECIRHICAGLSAKSIAEQMGITERTANYFIAAVAEKFATKGRSSLPLRAAWLGLLD